MLPGSSLDLPGGLSSSATSSSTATASTAKPQEAVSKTDSLPLSSLVPILLELCVGLVVWAWALLRVYRRRGVDAQEHVHGVSLKDLVQLTAGGAGDSVEELDVECARISVRAGDKTLVHSVDARFRSGTVTACMGPSGAGKTTFLKAVRRHLTGCQSHGGQCADAGRVTVNSCDPVQLLGAPAGGRVSFMHDADAFYERLTVYEMLCFRAAMCLPEPAQRTVLVRGLMAALGLTKCADVVIGSTMGMDDDATNGISKGERRRLSLALEMICVSLPRVLILDEPLSGLAATASLELVLHLRAIAHKMRCTVIMSIHCPRDDMGSLFDQLLIMRDGRLVAGASPFVILSACLPGEEAAIRRALASHHPPSSSSSSSAPGIVPDADDADDDGNGGGGGESEQKLRSDTQADASHQPGTSGGLFDRMMDHLDRLETFGTAGATVRATVLSPAAHPDEAMPFRARSGSPRAAGGGRARHPGRFSQCLAALGYFELQALRNPCSKPANEYLIWLLSGVSIGTFFHGMDHGQMAVFQRLAVLLLLVMAVTFKCQAEIIEWHTDKMSIQVLRRMSNVAPAYVFEVVHWISRIPEWCAHVASEVTVVYLMVGLRSSATAWIELILLCYLIVAWYRTVTIMFSCIFRDSTIAVNMSNLLVSIFTVASGFFKRRADSAPWLATMVDLNPMRHFLCCTMKSEIHGQTWAPDTMAIFFDPASILGFFDLCPGTSRAEDLRSLLIIVWCFRLTHAVVMACTELHVFLRPFVGRCRCSRILHIAWPSCCPRRISSAWDNPSGRSRHGGGARLSINGGGDEATRALLGERHSDSHITDGDTVVGVHGDCSTPVCSGTATDGGHPTTHGAKEVIFAFQDISYRVPRSQSPDSTTTTITGTMCSGVGIMPPVLSPCSGVVRAGQLLGIMGPSGAGKTTLLDLLAGRAKHGGALGACRGRVAVHGAVVELDSTDRLGGRMASSRGTAAATGWGRAYVHQHDELPEWLTPREYLYFCARLSRRGDGAATSSGMRAMGYGDDLRTQVDDILASLGLTEVANNLIGGGNGNRGDNLVTPCPRCCQDPHFTCCGGCLSRGSCSASGDVSSGAARGGRGLSGGERRRVSIGVAIAGLSDPGTAIFCDEVTSGLDSVSALRVVSALRELAERNGHAVILSIHQPPPRVYRLLTEVLLLGATGSMLYSGPRAEAPIAAAQLCHDLIPRDGYGDADYLLEVASLRRATLVSKLPGSEEQGQEAAQTQTQAQAQALEPVQGDDAESKNGSIIVGQAYLAKRWRELDQAAALDRDVVAALRRCSPHGHGRGTCGTAVTHATTTQQICILARRARLRLVRSSVLLKAHVVAAVAASIVISALWAGSGNIKDVKGLHNRMGVVFFCTLYLSFSSLSALTVFLDRRPLFVRERGAGMYTPLSYFFVEIAFDIIPLRVVPALVLAAIIYVPVGLNAKSAAHIVTFTVLLTLGSMSFAAIALLIGAASRTTRFANFVGGLSVLSYLAFAGVFVNLSEMPGFLSWLQYLTPARFSFDAMLSNELHGSIFTVTQENPMMGKMKMKLPGMTVLSTLGFSEGHLATSTVMLVVIPVAYLFATFLCVQLRHVDTS